MSNQVTMQFTKFTNLNVESEELEGNYGYRLYDTYEAVYNNTFNSFKELAEKITPETVAEYIHNNHPDFYTDAIAINGMFFNDIWYTPEELGIDNEDLE